MAGEFHDNVPGFLDTKSVKAWVGVVEDYLDGKAEHVAELARGIAVESEEHAKDYHTADQNALNALIQHVDTLVDDTHNIYQAQAVLDILNDVPKTGADEFNDAISGFKFAIEDIKEAMTLTDCVPS